ncbi:mediator of RNA polymerase II transcription subunit 21 [Pyrus ussuriensis x Pyrus communis]|uniref:Mediator of RNA polymerase II transcription subunit 21 n=1 Tax=Pyrus ussuriensis x Pyrus communis TaxID=2448454 RepID=A0A5N5FBI2_9ROSA|nr:mediator of RNA polymerase II transcription subunit 21 [Pyrus ussuriensis x Pyrus communis]
MDAINQLQEKVNTIATIAFTTIGMLQRDTPPIRISPNYPEARPAPALDLNPNQNPTLDSDTEFAKQPKLMNALVAALPLSEGGEAAQLKRIAQLQAENDAAGQQLEKQLEAAGQSSEKYVQIEHVTI